MTIEWNKVTRLSQFVAIVLFVLVFTLGFWLGMQYEKKSIGPAPQNSAHVGVIGDATYQCEEGKSVHALFFDEKVTIALSDGRTLNLGHTISGSGARYANEDDSIVFWEKGNTAFMTEGEETTYKDCVAGPIPQ